jgi:hypothetical protein
MKYLLYLIPIVFLIGLLVIVPIPREMTYDCRIAEISPDIPIAVKNECRKVAKNINNKQ